MDISFDTNLLAGEPLGSWLTLVLAIVVAYAAHRILGRHLSDAALRFGLAGASFSGVLALSAAYPRLALFFAPVLLAASFLSRPARASLPTAIKARPGPVVLAPRPVHRAAVAAHSRAA